MEERLFDKWIEALETAPEELHLREAFFDGPKFCALGLLYEIGMKEMDWDEDYPSVEFRNLVSDRLQEELGIDRSTALNLEHYVTVLNDQAEMTFKQIAELLKDRQSDVWRASTLAMSPEVFEQKYVPRC